MCISPLNISDAHTTCGCEPANNACACLDEWNLKIADFEVTLRCKPFLFVRDKNNYKLEQLLFFLILIEIFNYFRVAVYADEKMTIIFIAKVSCITTSIL